MLYMSCKKTADSVFLLSSWQFTIVLINSYRNEDYVLNKR